MSTEPLKIEQKLFDISCQIHNISKDSYNSFHKYEYISANKLFEQIKPLLTKHGLMIFPSCKSIVEKDGLTTIEMLYRVVDVDTSEVLDFIIPGQGYDKGDKGVFKAMTGALKYFLLQVFMISTDDDPETDNEPRQERQNDRADTKEPSGTKPKRKVAKEKSSTNESSGPNPWIWQIENKENKYCGRYNFEIPTKEIEDMLNYPEILSENDERYLEECLDNPKRREPTIKAWQDAQKAIGATGGIKQNFDDDDIPY